MGGDTGDAYISGLHCRQMKACSPRRQLDLGGTSLALILNHIKFEVPVRHLRLGRQLHTCVRSSMQISGLETSIWEYFFPKKIIELG